MLQERKLFHPDKPQLSKPSLSLSPGAYISQQINLITNAGDGKRAEEMKLIFSDYNSLSYLPPPFFVLPRRLRMGRRRRRQQM